MTRKSAASLAKSEIPEDVRVEPSVEIRRMPHGPEGFPYAVCHQGQILGWFTCKPYAEHLAISLQYTELIKADMGRSLLDTLYSQLRALRHEIGPIEPILPINK